MSMWSSAAGDYGLTSMEADPESTFRVGLPEGRASVDAEHEIAPAKAEIAPAKAEPELEVGL